MAKELSYSYKNDYLNRPMEKGEKYAKGYGPKSKALAKKAGKKPERVDTTGGMSAAEHNRRALAIEKKTGRDYNTGEKLNRK